MKWYQEIALHFLDHQFITLCLVLLFVGFCSFSRSAQKHIILIIKTDAMGRGTEATSGLNVLL